MNTKIIDQEGKQTDVVMGCYGIGLTRLMATIVELKYDSAKNKMLWPKEASPFDVHLISLNQNDEAEKIYDELTKKGFEVLFDDRDSSAGAKFAEADLVGAPVRIIISNKSLEQGGAEISKVDGEAKIVELKDLSSSI